MTLRAHAVVLVLTCCIASALSIALVTAPARAADDVAGKAARQHFQEGVAHYAERRFAQARLAFIQAYALDRQPAVLLKLAESELRSGHAADAAAHFATYLNENPQAGAAERRDAEKGLLAAKAKVGEVSLKLDTAGAEIFADGQPQGSSPLSGPLYLEPGNHKIEAHKDGKVASIAVQAQAGIATTANLAFGQSAAPAAAAGATPAPEGQATAAESPEADSGVEAELDTTKREPFLKWLGRRKLAWAGVGLTAIGLTGGIVFAVGASNSYDRADQVAEQIRDQAAKDNVSGPCVAPELNPNPDYAEGCRRVKDNNENGDTQRTLATVSFIVAGAAAAGTVVYYIIDSKPRKEAALAQPKRVQVKLTPMTTTSFGGLFVSGEF